jgi:hypothetical protein
VLQSLIEISSAHSTRTLLALSLVSSTIARAQLLDDSFETGGLDSGWQIRPSVPGITVGVSNAAAHRGTYGFRMMDTEVTLSGTAGTYAIQTMPLSAKSFYARVWVRMTQWNGQGNGITIFFLSSRQGSTSGSLYSFNLDSQNHLALVAQPISPQGTSSYHSVPTTVLLSDAGWHLLEAAAFDLNTDAGRRFLFMDGQEIASLANLADFPDAPPILGLGETWSTSGFPPDAGFAGIVDYDDVRVDVAPLPGLLAVSAPALPTVGACLPLTVSLSSIAPFPDGGPATLLPAPYDVAAHLDGLDVFSDDQCQQPDASVSLPRGALSATIYCRPLTAGPVTASVAQDGVADFLPGSVAIDVLVADAAARSDGGSSQLSYFACGSIGGSAAAWGALALTLALGLGSRQRR